MALLSGEIDTLLQKGFSRRQLGRIAGVLTAGAAFPFYNEFAMAQQAERRMRGGRESFGPDYVRINQNENPMGPSKEGLDAMMKSAPTAWRYSGAGEQGALIKAIAEMENVPEDHIAIFAGSSDPLLRTQCAFTSPTRSWTMGSPGYGGGAPQYIGSKVTRVPLRDDYAHDGPAMIKADPDAGAYYIVNPNNPTGTLTPRKDIDYLLANKRKDAILVIDEAYIHFTEAAQPCIDLVRADKDVLVMRTFSKIYGMAGIRAGFAMGRPDLLGKLRPYGPGFLPLPSIACAAASLNAKNLVSERRALNRRIRENTFAFLEKKGVKYIPSEANFFMMEVNRPHDDFARAMAAQKVIVGRMWSEWPTKVRVSVGSEDDMAKFKAAFEKVWA